eukprot:9487661-Pyramimonas_sp.AAC.1
MSRQDMARDRTDLQRRRALIHRAAGCEDLPRRHPLPQVGPQRHVRDVGGRRSIAQHGLARLGATDGQRGNAKLIAE